MTQNISIPADDELRKEIEDLAELEQRKLAPMARVLLREALNARKLQHRDQSAADRVPALAGASRR